MRTGKEAVPTQVRLAPEVHQWIKVESQRLDRSQNWLINNLLQQARAAAMTPKVVTQ